MTSERRTAILVLPLACAALAAFDYPFHSGPGTRHVDDIALPAGYERVTVERGSFADYVRHAPLLPEGSAVYQYDGQKVLDARDVAAVLDMPLLDATQQCADSALRYWFEYLHETGRDRDLKAKLTSGEKVDFESWRSAHARGARGQVAFAGFMKYCMNYVGSYSLSRDLPPVVEADLTPGCLIVQPNPKGGIGHLSMLFDVGADAKGHRAFLVGYGFLPAQSVHLARPDAPNAAAGSATWFTLQGFQEQHAYLGKTFVYRRFAP